MGNSKDDRTANLLAAAALGLDDAVAESVSIATGLDQTASTALIALLDFSPDGSVARLGTIVGLTHSGTVRLVDRLATLGYVERLAGPDARSRRVVLSRRGRVVARRARGARATVLHDCLAELEPQQRQALSELSAALVAGLARRRLAQRRSGGGDGVGALCRLCDFSACGRERGRCPAATAVSAVAADAADAAGG